MITFHSKIQELAYTIWESEGRPRGKEIDHYKAAQALMLAERERLISYWLEVEKVAMHFNDLIIRIRLQSLAAIGAILTFAAVLARLTTSPIPMIDLAAFSFCLALVWASIYVLDTCYYMKLLYGSVKELHSIEAKLSDYGIDVKMSDKIERTLENGKQVSFGKTAVWVAQFYYSVTFFMLISFPIIVFVLPPIMALFSSAFLLTL